MKRKNKKPMEYRVAKGIAFLNKEYGRSWLRKIDPESLVLENSKSCVLGQVEGGYDIGVDKLNINEPSKYGFVLMPRQRGRPARYSTLTRTWVRSIKRLQKLFNIEPPTAEV